MLTLAQVAAGAPVDRPVYVVGPDTRQWDSFRSPGGPHAGHLLLLRKLRRGAVSNFGVMQCVSCPGRPRWSFRELLAPDQDPRRPGEREIETPAQAGRLIFGG